MQIFPIKFKMCFFIRASSLFTWPPMWEFSAHNKILNNKKSTIRILPLDNTTALEQEIKEESSALKNDKGVRE